MELLDEHALALAKVRHPLLLNAVLCDLRMNPEGETIRLSRAEARCEEVLKREPGNTKAQFRRAQLHARAGEEDEAKALLEKLCKAHPTERAFRAELSALSERMRAARKQSDLFWADALKRQAAQAEAAREGGEREGSKGCAHCSSSARAGGADEPCLTRGAGPLTGDASLRGAARAAISTLPLASPIAPLISALRGVGLLWSWCSQMLWAQTAQDAAAGLADADAQRKREE
jgi:hypothetical protein